jgi:hypothetical protein
MRVHERDILRSADRLLGDQGAAVRVTRHLEICGDVLAEQREPSYFTSATQVYRVRQRLA